MSTEQVSKQKQTESDLELPKTVEILGIPYKIWIVEDIEEDDDDCVGLTVGDLRIIKIKKSQGTRRQWTTLIHEAVHATLHTVGLSNVLGEDVEEVIAQSLEHSIELFMRKHGKQFLEALRK